MARRRTTIRVRTGAERPMRAVAAVDDDRLDDTLDVRVLGPTSVSRDGRRLPVERPTHRRLVALLLLEPGARSSIDTLIERFWVGTPPRSARRSIHTHVSEVRRIVGADAIQTVDDGYRWSVELTRVDATSFERSVARASAAWQRNDVVRTLRSATTATTLWCDPPFAELVADDCAQPRVEELRARRRHAVELRAKALIRLGRGVEAIAELVEAVAAHPLDEQLVTLLVRAQGASGRAAEATRSVAAFRRSLAECGLTPSPELLEVERQILLDGCCDPTSVAS